MSQDNLRADLEDGAPLRGTGSREPDQQAVPALTGFDPARVMVVRVAAALRDACLKEFGTNWNNDVAFRFALAAIEAMRVPTMHMKQEAGDSVVVGCCNLQLRDTDDVWKAMIAAALEAGDAQ